MRSPISRIVIFGGVLMLGVGLLVTQSTPSLVTLSDDKRVLHMNSDADVSTQSPTEISTATVVPSTTPAPSSTVTPNPQVMDIDILMKFSQIPIQAKWSDTFDDATSGWEPRYEIAMKNQDIPLAYNGYVDGSYEFFVRYAYDTSAMLWDFNSTHPLPEYPYTVLTKLSAPRDINAVVMADYQGDFGDINNGSGVIVVFSLKEVENTLGPEFGSRLGAIIKVYEIRPSQTWELQCDTTGTWPEVRTALMALHVDRQRIAVELAPDDATITRVSVVCQRVSAPLPNISRYIGIGAVHANPIELEDYTVMRQPGILRIDTMVMAQRTAEIQALGGNKEPQIIPGGGCQGLRTYLPIIDVLGELYGRDWRMCDGGAYEVSNSITIIPYDANVQELYGNWQCGSDEDNRISIAQNGNFLQLANQYLTRRMIYVVDDRYPKRDKYFTLTNEESRKLSIGMRVDDYMVGQNDGIYIKSLFLTYRNGQLNTNWAGSCIRVE